MLLTALTPTQSLEKAYRLQSGNREQIDRFRANFTKLLGLINEKESEENVKGHLMDFLKEVYYNGAALGDSYLVAPKGKTDFVIHAGKDATAPAGVLFEVKRPANKGEMITRQNLNAKAFHELLLYYFRERLDGHNNDIRYCVITNVYEWFIFDAAVIDRLFFRNAHLTKEYKAWVSKQKVSTNNELFYNEIAKPFLAALDEELAFTYFDLRDFQTIVTDADTANDKALLPLYKVLSPTHLLKLPTATDSNRLNPKFYSELLHLIGLEEVKEGGKKIIRRKDAGKRDEGALLENALIELDSSGKFYQLHDRGQYGATTDEQQFSVALELCITWVNRVLFLKLLESQLVKYHAGSRDYAFLNRETIPDFDELNKLFFRVLARKPSERQPSIQAKFGKIPYLNSSLFELTELENDTFPVSQLDNSQTLPILRNSVLNDNPAYKGVKDLPTLSYPFAFLDAYDFASESRETIQEKNRTLINASVLGLIFEKINGYKDGSFYTPGFITEYMCRETIRKAVVQKFNDVKGWNCADFSALENKDFDRAEANTLINEIHVCDPAVGSGHFLVSALNELIAVKSDLGVLQDETGKRIKDYTVTILNDELIVQDEDETPFQYVLQATGKPTAERQRVQKTLFHEKQTIIENCLFGVDINPNSVKICRLRLWIELLKNAYYTDASGFAELETLPNIDINIKQGNSLIRRFELETDLSKVLRSSKYTISQYRQFVQDYKNSTDKNQKKDLENLITQIKQNFRTEIAKYSNPDVIKLQRLGAEYYQKYQAGQLFGIEYSKAQQQDKNRLEREISELNDKLETVQNNKVYIGSFEWRFEFPEVLDDKGNFVGFDAIIGNPPYVFARDNFSEEIKGYFISNFETAQYQLNLYLLFIEQAIRLLNNKGLFSYIIPNSFLMVSSATLARKLILDNCSIQYIASLLGETFEGVNVETIIISALNKPFEPDNNNEVKIYSGNLTRISYSHSKSQTSFLESHNQEFNVFSNLKADAIKLKLTNDSTELNELVQIRAGLMAYEIGKGNPKQTSDDVKNRIYDFNYQYDYSTFQYIEGKDVNKYNIRWSGTYLKYGNNLASPRTFDLFNSPRIIIREITSKHPSSIIATYTDNIYLFNRSNIGILERYDSGTSLKYILAILNSKLISYYFITNTPKAVRQMFPKLILQDLRKFPFKRIDEYLQLPFINIVDQILSAKAANLTADTSTLEAEIDRLVYALYELTDEEIAIVEGR